MPDENKAKKWPQFLAAICICIGAAGTGSVIGWTSNISTDLKNGTLNGLEMDDEQLSWVGSMMTLGALVMCFPIGIVADMIGRKPTVLMTSIPFIIGWVCILLGPNIILIYIGRFLTGMAGGSFCITAPLYTSEIAQTEIRGMLGTFFQLFITLGILYANVFGMAVHVKFFVVLCLIIPVVFGVVFLFMPETPVFLMKKQKAEKAEKAFKRLRGKDYNAGEEMKNIQAQIDKDKERTESLFVLMKTKQAKKATLICFSLMFYQQLSGINAIMFYTEAIFKAAGVSVDFKVCTVMVGAVQVVATLVASALVERAGRKWLLMLSDAGMAVGTFLVGLFFTLKNNKIIEEEELAKIGFIPIIGVILFIIAFSIGFGPIPWLASAEIFPPELMCKLASAAAAFNWFLAFLVSKLYLTLANGIGNDITFYIFTVVSFTGIFFVAIMVPETKNKTFAEIQEELGK